MADQTVRSGTAPGRPTLAPFVLIHPPVLRPSGAGLKRHTTTASGTIGEWKKQQETETQKLKSMTKYSADEVCIRDRRSSADPVADRSQFVGAGEKAGLLIWRIENLKPVPVKAADYGKVRLGGIAP